MNNPRVRFAPSPTGYLHIGGARTALFNWLFAKQNKGKFLLRIEDTDLERSKTEYIDQITDALSWLNLDWDEDIVLQSNNKERHQEMVQKMLDSDTAYRCFLQKDELDQLRQASEQNKEIFRVPQTYRDLSKNDEQKLLKQGKSFTVRLKVPEGETEFTDLVYGTIKVQNKDLDDFIIARSDGSPTYNFVVAIDDSDMNISHVVRGDDHLANTPKQILVYKALGLNEPIFAHLPMILGSDKKRLSKRHAATNVQEYKDKGFTAQIILNYLSLLGWNPDSEQEIFSKNELIENFQFDQVQKKSAVFDEKKLLWISQQHLTGMSIRENMNEIYKLNPDWGDGLDLNYLKETVKLIKDRSKTIKEIADMSELFFQKSLEYDQELLSKTFKEESISITEDFKNALESCQDWNRNEIEQIFDNLMSQHDVQIGKVMKPIRVALTGIPYGPGIFDLIILLGKDMCLKRLRKLLSLLN
jgi:glutamyl-tRNA synthetase|tara:strand:- start:685 stop:2097 length:1413 start_codon:yes stop_codon:yes gene_type:complete